jgi:hypothetical protein
MKWTKLLALLMELFRLRVQLSTITMPLLWQRSLLLRLPRLWYYFYISNPSAVDTSVYFVQQMVRLEVRITRLLM